MGQFTDKSALITGGGRGSGRAAALALASEGAHVLVSDTEPQAGAETVQLISAAGGTASFIDADPAIAEEVTSLIGAVMRAHGRLDYAVNSAGFVGQSSNTVDQLEEDFDKAISSNLKGVFLCMRAEIGAMLETGGGSIVNLASSAGLDGWAGLAPLVASHHGIVGLTKTAAIEYAKRGIRVNVVCPTIMDPAQPATSLANEETSAANEPLDAADVPTHGLTGLSRRVADQVIWLCSSEASHITGTAISVEDD